MSYTNTIETIKERTGLKEPFIRKVVNQFADIFNPYMARGDKNSLIFDENAMQLFDQIKQAREQGLGIEFIKRNLEKSLKNKESKSTSNTDQSNLDKNSNTLLEQALKAVQDMNQAVLTAKDKLIEAKEQHIKDLNNQLLFLTDGKAPEIFQAENKDKDIRLAVLEHDLEHKNILLEKFEANKKKEKELVQELNNLDGKYFQGKKRKMLLQELQSIN